MRAGSRGALVVDGGPGTGKTVVALHRTAYLLYADPRLGHRRGGVLFVGPHQPYLAYVADVLPSLGEEGVQTCTVRDLVPEGATAGPEPDPEVARLKSSVDMVRAIEPAVRLYEEPPTQGMEVATPWSDVWLSADEWAEAFASPDPGYAAQRGARPGVGGAAHDPGRQARRRGGPGRPAPPGAVAEPRPAHRPPPGVAAARADRSRGRPVGGAGVPAPVRSLADARRGPHAAAVGPAGLDGVRPAAPGRGAAAARRPRGVTPQAPARGRRLGGARADGAGGRPPDRRRTTPRCRPDVDAARSGPAGQWVDEGARRAPTPTCSPVRSRTSSSTRPRSSPTPSGRCCCCAARPAASRSSGTAPRPGTASPSPGRSGSSGSGWTRSSWPP